MQKFIVTTGISLLFSTIAFAEIPEVKPGFWKITQSHEGKPDRVMENCVDKDSIKQMVNMGQQMMGASCTSMDMKKEGSKYVGDVTCTFGTTKIISHSVYEGDFQSAYTFTNSSKFEPAMMGKSDSQSKGSATYVGPCPAGMQAGDIKTPDGKIINPTAMMKNMPKDFMKNVGDLMKKMPPPPQQAGQ